MIDANILFYCYIQGFIRFFGISAYIKILFAEKTGHIFLLILISILYNDYTC